MTKIKGEPIKFTINYFYCKLPDISPGTTQLFPRDSPGKKLGGGVRSASQNLTTVTQVIYDLTKNSIPYLWPALRSTFCFRAAFPEFRPMLKGFWITFVGLIDNDEKVTSEKKTNSRRVKHHSLFETNAKWPKSIKTAKRHHHQTHQKAVNELSFVLKGREPPWYRCTVSQLSM